MGELQNSLGLLLAASSKTSSAPSSSMSACTSSLQPLGYDRFEYGALGEMMVSVATRSQLKTPSETLNSVRDQVAHDEPNARHKGPANNIGQSRLPLSFGLADLASTSSQGTTSKDNEVHVREDMLKGLARKVLEMPLFSGFQLQHPNFDAALVYHMAGKMFQGTMQIPANAAMKETEELSMVDVEEGIKHEAIRGVVDALRRWKDWEKEPPAQAQFNGGLTLEHDSLDSLSVKDMATVCLASIPVRTTRERLQFTPGIVRLSNVNKVFSVAQDSSTSVFPQKVLLDTGAQPVMLGRSLAENLGLSAKDLDPCPFTIATSLRGIEHPMGLTKAPLRLQFNIGTVAYTHISLRCVVTNATTYDILLGQQALYPIGFGHDSWMEEAWFRLGWSQGDGQKEALPVIFGSLASTTRSQTD